MKIKILLFLLTPSFFLQAQVIDTAVVLFQFDSLLTISNSAIRSQKYEEGVETSRIMLKLAEDKLGKNTKSYAKAAYVHGRALYFMGRFQEAEPHYLESMKIKAKIFGKNNKDYASSLVALGILQVEMEQFEKAEASYLEAQAIQSEILKTTDPTYAVTLSCLGILYKKTGQFDKAEKLYLEARDIQSKAGKESKNYALSLISLGTFYAAKGQWHRAEPLWLEAKEIQARVLGKSHPNYAESLNNLGALYFTIGQYEKAEPYWIEVKDIWGIAPGKSHPVYAEALDNLGNLSFRLSQFEKAEQYFREALTCREQSVGKAHSTYAISLQNFAILFIKSDQYEKAEIYLLEAIEIIKSTLGVYHPNYAGVLEMLGDVYRITRQYSKAESFYNQSKEIRANLFGEENVEYAGTLYQLAKLYQSMKKSNQAKEMYEVVISLHKRQMIQYSKHLSVDEIVAYIDAYDEQLNNFLSFAQTEQTNSNIFGRESYDNALFYKGFILNNRFQDYYSNSTDSSLIEKNNLLKSFHRRLAAQYALPIAERDSAQIADLEEKANTIEKELVRTVAGFAETRKQVTWQEVQTQLQSNEAAIEFVHYGYYTPNATDSVLYSALVLRPGWESPRMVYLCEQRQLDSLLQGADAGATVGQLYASRGITPGNKTLSGQLHQLLWQPLDSLLGGVNTVYFSPSGLLHRVAFHAIPTPNKNEVLADRYKLFQLFSTRSLAVNTINTTFPASATFFGGIRYDVEAITPTSDSLDAWAAVPFSSSLLPSTRSRRGEGWQYLPGTAQEVERLQRLFQQQHIQSATWTDTLASEERFKTLGTTGASPAILHLATHGFFFPDPKLDKNRLHGLDGNSIPLSENPLMRSGLLLAGANQAWKEGKPLPGKEDGILTAYEIAQVNLSGTQLAVLSACETGLGDIQASEGVMGLQRAFKMAGVEKLIVSLWQVPDKQTAVFMESFYTNWLTKGSNIRDAFYDTQSQMRKRYKDPFVWAGFVLVE